MIYKSFLNFIFKIVKVCYIALASGIYFKYVFFTRFFNLSSLNYIFTKSHTFLLLSLLFFIIIISILTISDALGIRAHFSFYDKKFFGRPGQESESCQQ